MLLIIHINAMTSSSLDTTILHLFSFVALLLYSCLDFLHLPLLVHMSFFIYHDFFFSFVVFLPFLEIHQILLMGFTAIMILYNIRAC